MSGRSGYRKTDRKRNRFARPVPKSDYVLRLQLPKSLAFALSPGEHGWGITVGFNDLMFSHGTTPAHCCQFAADFLNKIGARENPQAIAATIMKLLPCSAHAQPVRRDGGFRSLGADLEAIHDNLSRNAGDWRPCTVDIAAEQIRFAGVATKRIVFEFADGRNRHGA